MADRKFREKLNEKLSVSKRDESSCLNPECALTKRGCKCQGVGFSLVTNGAYVSAELCECVKNCPACFGSTRVYNGYVAKSCKNPSPIQIVNIFNNAYLPARYVDAEISKFDNHTGNYATVLRSVMRWLENFKNEGGVGLLLSGPVGVGKTFLLAAITKTLAKRGIVVRFADFNELLSVIKAGYSEKKSEESVLQPLLDADVLVIDELGKGRNTEWEQEKLDQLIMRRYNSNRVVVASTNYLLREDSEQNRIFNVDLENPTDFGNSFNPDVFGSLESRIGKRIFSRLNECSLMIEMKGEDYRKKAAQKLRTFESEIND